MRASRALTLGTVLVIAAASLPLLVSTAGAQEAKVAICHRTNSASNPYTSNELPVSAVDGGNDKGDHFGEHKGPLASSLAVAEQLKDAKVDWGDIIPPVAGFHEGLNWPEGQAMLEAGCVFVTPTGSLRVTKDVDGSAPANTSFTVAVNCDGSDFDATFTFDETGALDPAGQDDPITDIPAGTDCTVTETGDGGANAVTYDPGGANPPTVTIAAGQQTTVTVTNTFIEVPPGTGALLVSKDVDGDAGASATFTVGVNCSVDTFDTTLTFDDAGALTSGTNPITGLPLNTTCTVTETDDGGADSVSYDPGNANPPTVTITTAGATVTVVVTNTFDPPPRKVFICHRTNSETNPYEHNEVDESAVDGVGNGDHFNEHTGPLASSLEVAQQLKDNQIKWGDIIPPVGSHNGLNWPEGQAMLENGCEFVNATGSLRVTKVVDGNGTPPANTTFTVAVNCDGTDFDATFTFDETGALDPAGQDDPITDIPAGTDCTVTETGDGGADAVTYNPGGVNPPTVTIETGVQASVTVTNTFVDLPPGTGGLLVTKSIEGTPDSGTSFTVGVDCSVDTFDTTLTFDDAGALTSGTNPITSLPLNTTCTVTETDDGGADSVSYDPGNATPPTVTIITSGAVVTVVVTNTFDPPARKVFICHRTNSETNPYELNEVDESAVDGVGNGDHFNEHTGPLASSLEVAQQLKDNQIKWGDIIPPVGSHNGLNWPEGQAMLENGCEFVTAEGSLLVTKALAGNGSPVPGILFAIAVDCDDDAFDATLTFDETGALDPASQANPITGVPAGTTCTVTEFGTAGADAVTYNPGGANPPTVTIEAGAQSSVTVTNTFVAVPPGTGALLVTKVVEGTPDSGAVFTIAVDCSDDAFDTTLTFDETGALDPPNQSDPLLGLPLSTTCTVAETIDGGADSVAYDPGGADPPTVTITTSGAVVTVVVTNTFDVIPPPPPPPPPPNEPPDGEVTVRKVVEGEPPDDARFVVRVDCDTLSRPVELVFSEDSRRPKSVDDIPLPTECEVVETDDGGASEVEYSPEDPEFRLTADRPERTVTVTNEFDDADEPPKPEEPPKPDEPDEPERPRPPAKVEPPTPVHVDPPVRVTVENPVVQATLPHTGSSWAVRLLKTAGIALVIGLLFMLLGRRRVGSSSVPALVGPAAALPPTRGSARPSQEEASDAFQRAVADFISAFDHLKGPLLDETERGQGRGT